MQGSGRLLGRLHRPGRGSGDIPHRHGALQFRTGYRRGWPRGGCAAIPRPDRSPCGRRRARSRRCRSRRCRACAGGGGLHGWGRLHGGAPLGRFRLDPLPPQTGGQCQLHRGGQKQRAGAADWLCALARGGEDEPVLGQKLFGAPMIVHELLLTGTRILMTTVSASHRNAPIRYRGRRSPLLPSRPGCRSCRWPGRRPPRLRAPGNSRPRVRHPCRSIPPGR